jgi:hypothetical protein
MVTQDDGHPLPMDRRMAIFQAVVEMQDTGVPAVVSRRRVAKQFGVSESHVRRIEEEGLQGNWPPL